MTLMGVSTRSLLSAEITVAKRSARRALWSVALFVAWLLCTWLGPDARPPAGWSLAWIAAAIGIYSVLTVGAVVALGRAVMHVVRTGVLRRVISQHLAPFWMVASGAVLVGGGVWASADGAILSAWLGAGTALALVTSAFAAARTLEANHLETVRAQLADAPPGVALRTWKREIRARLGAS